MLCILRQLKVKPVHTYIQTHLYTDKYTWLCIYTNINVLLLLKTVMVCRFKTNLFQREVIHSSCNKTERYPYTDGSGVTAFVSVKQEGGITGPVGVTSI